jgi:hypothetical protein
LNCEGIDSALIYTIERVTIGGFEMSAKKVLMLDYQRMRHPSFNALIRLYPSLFEKADKSKFVCDACEFGKLTRSSYDNSDHRSFCVFDMIHSDVWVSCFTNSMNDYRYFVIFIDCFSRVT